jgi:Reverse transcriptase (RNA-dependent DNA polymerase)
MDKSTLASTPTDEINAEPPPSPIFNPADLIGRTFLMDEQEDGQKFRGRVVELIEDHESKVEDNPTRIEFRVSVNEDKAEEIITNNKMSEYITRDEGSDIQWKFRRIVSHEYKGSQCNVLIEWENGEITSEPLKIIAADDPVTCAIYARENDLLDKPGSKRFKPLPSEKRSSLAWSIRLSSGHTILHLVTNMVLKSNSNTLWGDATVLELTQIDEYTTFIDKGHHTKVKAPIGCKKIRVHLIYDVKHDGRHIARLVADDHLTDIPLESVYSGVVSLRGFRIVLFLAELNHLELWSTDIGNAYLEAYTSEKVYIIAGPEFGEREGHILIIRKALYRLRSSGARLHCRFADCIREIGFFPCKPEPDIWMRKKGNLYEYIAVYVDDLAIAMTDPKELMDILEKKHKFKLKGTGPITFHFGMDFTRDDDNTLCISPTKYIDKLVKNYEKSLVNSAPWELESHAYL